MPQAVAAWGCWRNWLRQEITPHDGLVRAGHPVLRTILDRTQSASSLRQLLRNPIGFVWKYGLRWHAPESNEDPLVLTALAMGDLVHMTLERALRTLEADGGLATAAEERIAAALLHGPEQIADLPVPVAESPGAVRIGHPERSHLVEYLAPNSVFNSLPRQRSSPHLRPDDRLVTIDRVLHHASLGVA